MLRRMRELVRSSAYIMTVHAVEEMEADGMTVFDVEHCVLTGRIVARQAVPGRGGWKYLVQGSILGGESAFVVARTGPTDKLVVITVYLG